MTPTERAACVAALEAAEQAAKALRAVLGASERASPELVPLAVACRVWGVSKETGLKRAQRGLGRKIAGRWHVPTCSVADGQYPRDPATSNEGRVVEARPLPSARVAKPGNRQQATGVATHADRDEG